MAKKKPELEKNGVGSLSSTFSVTRSTTVCYDGLNLLLGKRSSFFFFMADAIVARP